MQSYPIRKRNQKISVQEDDKTSKMEIIKKRNEDGEDWHGHKTSHIKKKFRFYLAPLHHNLMSDLFSRRLF